MDITEVVKAVIVLLATAISAFLIPWLKAKLGTEKWAKVVRIIDVAIKAAEEFFKGQGLGDQKRDFVIDYLAKNGIILNEVEVRTLIDSRVWDLINKFKEDSAA